MPVVPRPIEPVQDCKTLYKLLSSCQKSLRQSLNPERRSACAWISISQDVDSVDPLLVLHQFNTLNQPHFYFEKPYEGEAVAAFGKTLSLGIGGDRRFSKIQQFLEHSLIDRPRRWSGNGLEAASMGITSPTDLRYFCSFTFFDEPKSIHSPFSSAMVLLPEWQILRQPDRCLITANVMLYADTNLTALTDSLWLKFQKIQQANYSLFSFANSDAIAPPVWEFLEINDFQRTVEKALRSIHQNRLQKLVLSHAVDVTARRPFDWLFSLHNLRQFYPDCYIFSVNQGGGKTFIGASPERLVSVRNRRLTTDALAGSAPRGRTTRDDAALGQTLLNTPKERHEHQVVVDFLRDRLLQLGLSPQMPAAPDLLRLSNIQHLHTPIHAHLPAKLHPLELVAALHPTPAVAGLPRDIACDEIRRYEGFGRSLYAAPLGWVDAAGNAEFIVGIRSAMLEGDRARLYAGAGIVAGSDPARELAEVKLKLQALLKALV
jgi:menaquinone-specific isochorismate synthase